MKVIVGCELSQVVMTAFLEKGHDAYSCDTEPCEGNYPERHYQEDILQLLKREEFDLGLFFPPYTHLANAGGCHFEKKRKDGRQKEAIIFVMKLLAVPINKIALENPVGILSSDWYIQQHFPELMPNLLKVNMPRKPNQVIQPFYFGDNVRKYTCLWTKNLKSLVWVGVDDLFNKSQFVKPAEPTHTMIRKGKYRTGTIRKIYWQELLPKKDRAKIKSKTFPGIAKAMANQWG